MKQINRKTRIGLNWQKQIILFYHNTQNLSSITTNNIAIHNKRPMWLKNLLSKGR